jgi:hypothetical protein
MADNTGETMPTTSELHDQLVRQLQQLVTADDWTAMMHAASRFHGYSARNVMLIQAQRPDATRIAGYGTWKKLGRHVKKGAKGIAILAPCPTRTATDNDETPSTRRVNFRTAYVFDEADTEGEELANVLPVLLDGDAPHAVWVSIAELIEEHGFTIDRRDCSPANGVTRWLDRSVSVRPGLEPAQAVKTLTHELGHIICDHGTEPRPPRDVAEVEAESIAYIVCAVMGIESDSYSFPYVARWSGGDIDLVRATADRVVRRAHEVITQLTTRQPA